MTAESTARHEEHADPADSNAQAPASGEIFEGPRSSTLVAAAAGLAMLAAGI
ncbi:hypothetical protein USB125703_01380 [Pseudoclavibacter triregionum]|nr:hypothetical protein USB125703_01380 [Pseudoclavibacter triregionum]